jgi:hypothetical protein
METLNQIVLIRFVLNLESSKIASFCPRNSAGNSPVAALRVTNFLIELQPLHMAVEVVTQIIERNACQKSF